MSGVRRPSANHIFLGLPVQVKQFRYLVKYYPLDSLALILALVLTSIFKRFLVDPGGVLGGFWAPKSMPNRAKNRLKFEVKIYGVFDCIFKNFQRLYCMSKPSFFQFSREKIDIFQGSQNLKFSKLDHESYLKFVENQAQK